MKHAALYVSIAVSAGLLLGPAFAGSLNPADDPAPIGLTASLDAVPTLTPVALPSPYKMEWQQRLEAFEVNFVANIPARATSPGVDPIETGSINAAR